MLRYPCGSCLAELNDSGSASCESSCTAVGPGPRNWLKVSQEHNDSVLQWWVRNFGAGKEEWGREGGLEQLLVFS